MKVVPDYDFKTAPQPRVIVIPAMNLTGTTQEMYDWIREASKRTDITMSVCNGAFVLAKTAC
jgi:transcriptional regulator GlxA family with amidase domain